MIGKLLRRGAGKGQRGTTLVEVMVSLALLGVIGASFLSGTAATSSSRMTADEQASAKIIAEGILDHVKKLEFATSYNFTLPAEYPGYTANLTVDPIRNDNIQKLTVAVLRHGDIIFTLEGYKAVR